MGELINLRRVRKTKSRSAADAQAADNRAKHGIPKALRTASKTEREREARAADARKLETD